MQLNQGDMLPPAVVRGQPDLQCIAKVQIHLGRLVTITVADFNSMSDPLYPTTIYTTRHPTRTRKAKKFNLYRSLPPYASSLQFAAVTCSTSSS